MLRKWILIGTVCLLMSLILGGCGIAQEQYDAVNDDLDQARQALDISQGELDTAKAGLDSIKAELDSAKAELDSAKAELDTAKTDLDAATSGLEAAQSTNLGLTSSLGEARDELVITELAFEAFVYEVDSLWNPLDNYLGVNHDVLAVNAGILTDDTALVYAKCKDITTKLAVLNDTELQALWEPAFVESGAEWNLYYTPFERFMNKLDSRIQQMVMDIRESLGL